MTSDIEHVKRETLQFALLEVQRVRCDYQAFCQQDAPTDPKAFGAYHMACKTALTHMEVLLRLVRWASRVSDLSPPETETVTELLKQARSAVANTPRRAAG